MGIQYGAPFAQTGLDRLKGEIFGNERAARSTDVIIYNKSSKSFKLEASDPSNNDCKHGGYSTGLFPDYEIQAKQAAVYGMESHGFARGVKCTTRYVSSDGSFFELINDNPYVGKNWMDGTKSDSLGLTPTRGQGNNNQVRWIIEDA